MRLDVLSALLLVAMRAACWYWMLLGGGAAVTTVDAFSTVLSPAYNSRSSFVRSSSPSKRRKTTTTLLGSSSSGDDERSDNNNGPWKSPNDFRTFLNQCSVQSFMFLVRQMRDPQTVLWMEQFSQPTIVHNELLEREDESNYMTGTFVNEDEERQKRPASKLLRYHGLAAMNTTLFPTWDTYFRLLLKEPTVTYIIESDQAHIPDYELEINPASLCSRILSVREQIANEFVRDLQVIANMGNRTVQSYWENLQAQREAAARSSESGNDNDDDDGSANNLNQQPAQQQVGIERTSTLFLEQSDVKPSPLRKGNFDLLCLCCTQESIHRVLNDESRMEGGSAEWVSNEFLKSFYSQRVTSHFTGAQRYGRADDFFEELLMSTPRMIQLDKDVMSLIDPMRIAELILKEREKVALEWKEVASESPREHMEIRRLQLNRMMGIDTDDDTNE